MGRIDRMGKGYGGSKKGMFPRMGKKEHRWAGWAGWAGWAKKNIDGQDRQDGERVWGEQEGNVSTNGEKGT
jgi:hypothetical protein